MPWCAGRAVAPLEAHQAGRSRAASRWRRPPGSPAPSLPRRIPESGRVGPIRPAKPHATHSRAGMCGYPGPIGDNVGTMLTRQKPPPQRGSFDYLIEPVIRAPVPPPLPPEHGGRHPQRIRIEIEITDRRLPPRPQGRFGTITLILLLIAVLMALAGCTSTRAQPSSWQSYREGFMTACTKAPMLPRRILDRFTAPISKRQRTGRTGSSPTNWSGVTHTSCD